MNPSDHDIFDSYPPMTDDLLPALTYADVAVSLMAEGFEVEAQVVPPDSILLRVPMGKTTGFFYVMDDNRQVLPAARPHQNGWHLIVQVPPDLDPEGNMDDGALIYMSDDPDVALFVAAVSPTIRLITGLVSNGA